MTTINPNPLWRQTDASAPRSLPRLKRYPKQGNHNGYENGYVPLGTTKKMMIIVMMVMMIIIIIIINQTYDNLRLKGNLG